MSGTVSRVLSWTIIYLDPPLPTGSSDLPAPGRAAHKARSDLASDGVYTAADVTACTVSSYLAFSPLLSNEPCERLMAER